MSIFRSAALATVVVAVAAAAVPAAFSKGAGSKAAQKDRFDLKGQVYQAFKIEMKNSANRPLKTIRAGTYRIKVEDKAAIHNFHLTGRGVNRATSVPGVVETFWTVTLKPGQYTFFCDPHRSTMRGSFRVTP